MAKKAFRHGDVIIVKTDENFTDLQGVSHVGDLKKAKKEDQLILAKGEQTGHAHRLNSSSLTVRVNEKNKNDENIYFTLDEKATVKHEEHKPITLEPGNYYSFIQREYDEVEETRRVID